MPVARYAYSYVSREILLHILYLQLTIILTLCKCKRNVSSKSNNASILLISSFTYSTNCYLLFVLQTSDTARFLNLSLMYACNVYILMYEKARNEDRHESRASERSKKKKKKKKAEPNIVLLYLFKRAQETYFF